MAKFRKYLPSPTFTVLIFSVLVAGGLIYGAELITTSHTQRATLTAAVDNQTNDHTNWEAALYEIQAQDSSSTLPAAPDEETVDGLRKAAESSNVTDTISRTLLVNLANAKAQGMGDDIPTQDELIKTAIQQIPTTQPTKNITLDDLTVVKDSPDTRHTYGNALFVALKKTSNSNNVETTFVAIDDATSQNNAKLLAPLASIEHNYRSTVINLLAVPVPETLAPFHLQLIKEYEAVADTYPDMEVLLTDPVRGLAGLQRYQSLSSQTVQVFINIAQVLHKNGILFTKDEPGALWSYFLSLQ